MKITKAKLKNRSLDIEYDETTTFINSEGEAIESTREHAVKCNEICHDSLIYAFDRLRPHAALIADLREAIKVENAILKTVQVLHGHRVELKRVQLRLHVI